MKTVWDKMSDAKMKKVMRFAEDYKDFLNRGKTEREQVRESIKEAEKKGYKNLFETENLKAGDKVYVNNRNKSLCLFVIGKKPLKEGMNILGAHIDSPRLDIKQNPLYEESGIALLDTHYYGGIKKYQWVAQPLALHGVVCKKDGTVVDICIGEKDDDPVVGISDLLIHLAQEQMKKPGATVVEGEDLNITVGSLPLKGKKENPVKENVLALLKEKYDIEEDDFISAEIEVVPAGKARDYGLDRSMVFAYGQDDKICAYTSLMALLDSEDVPAASSSIRKKSVPRATPVCSPRSLKTRSLRCLTAPANTASSTYAAASQIPACFQATFPPALIRTMLLFSSRRTLLT